MIQKTLNMGPIHPWLPGAMKLNLNLEGDRIVSAEPEFGFSNRGILNRVCNQPLEVAQRYFSRIEPESAFVIDCIFSELIEKSTETQITGRAKWIREITVEMGEAIQVLKYLSSMAGHFGLPMLSNLILKHREELLDLSERLTGSRYGYYFIIPGGSRYDITDGFLERIEAWSERFIRDYPRLQALFCWTLPFQNRLDQLGLVLDDGSFGFISEARFENSRLGWNSSVGSRLRYAMAESLTLSKSILELTQKIETGDRSEKLSTSVLHKKVELEFDTFRGAWKVSFEITPALRIKSATVITPSDQIKAAVPMILEEEVFDDIPIILASACLSVTEVDQ